MVEHAPSIHKALGFNIGGGMEINPLVSLCLSYFSNIVTKFHDEDNFEKKAFYRFKGVEFMMLEQGHVNRDS